MKQNTYKRGICLILVAALLFSCFSLISFAETESYEQNFNTVNPSGVTLADSTITHVARPADGADAVTDAYQSGDGAVRIAGSAGKAATVTFDKSYDGQIVYEMDFRVDERTAASGAGHLRFARMNGGNVMVTSGNMYDDYYEVRYNYVNSSGANTNAISNLKLDYKKWYHLTVTINSLSGTISISVDDTQILPETATTNLEGFALKNVTAMSNTSVKDSSFFIDNIKVTASSAELSDNTTVTSAEYTVSGTEIKNVPVDTAVDVFKASVILPAKATAELYQEDGTTVRTGTVQEGDKLIVTAQDGKTTAAYTIVLKKEATLFVQDFNTAALSGVTIGDAATITHVARPADDADTVTDAYQSGDGALRIAGSAGKKATIDFGASYGNLIVYEMDFRVDEKAEGSTAGQLRFSRLNDGAVMFTSGTFSNDSYTVRYNYVNSEGKNTNAIPSLRLAYKKWHHAVITINSVTGSISILVNNEEILKETETTNLKGFTLKNVTAMSNTTVTDSVFLIDNIKVNSSVPKPSDKTEITSSEYVVGESSITVKGDITSEDFKEKISLPVGAAAELYQEDGKTVRTGTVQEGDKLIVTAQDGVTTKTYTVKILVLRTEYYVSPDGDDTADGSLETPFKTLAQAKAAVQLAKESGQPITVYFKAGTYPMTDTVVFTEADSGTADAPITYQAYGDGEVIFKGSETLDSSVITKVTNQDILDRVISNYAKSKLMQIDLKKAGITEYPVMPDVYGYAYGGYKPMEVYINGSALKEARWPNGDSFLRVTATDGKTQGFMMEYADDTNRASMWQDSIDAGEVYIGGTPGHTYAFQRIRLASLDAKNNRVVAKGSTNYTPTVKNGKFYFTNLLEEIDLPGESYLDRTTGILYFYPESDLKNAEIEVSTFDKTGITMNKTSYVNFKDLTFSYTRGNILNASKVSHVVLDGCEISHTSSNAITLDGTDCTIQNCHIYDLGGAAGTGAIHLSGGDRKTLTPSGNKILNNRLHRGDRVYTVGQAPLIRVSSGVGHVIENNEIYDGSAYVVQLMGANDIQFNYNEVYDAVRMSSDAGALTWGRDVTLLGFEVKYNYFHHMGNVHGGVGQQSIFYDDGATGPYAYGNIFYQGTVTADMTTSVGASNSAVKTNGGRYGVFENNIFVDSVGAVYFQPWNNNIWWKRVNETDPSNNHKYFTQIKDSGMLTDTWKEHYKDSQWAPLWEHFSEDSYAEAQELYQNNKTDELNQLAEEKENGATNYFNNNIAIKISSVKSGTIAEGNGVDTNSYVSDTDKLSNGNSIFVDYGKDFKLTDEGLAEVVKSAKNFKNIPTELIGLQTYDRNGKAMYVGGREPSADDAIIAGSTKPGGVMNVRYSFSDSDGDPEGVSEILWYYSDTKNGKYERIQDALGKEFVITDDMAGFYVKCQIVPYDVNGIHGEELWSDAVQIALEGDVDKDALRNAIARAKELLSSAAIGSEEGQYPKTAAEQLEAAIKTAEEILNSDYVNQTVVNRAVNDLIAEQNLFQLNQVESDTAESMTLNKILKDSANWEGDGKAENGSLTVNKNGVTYTNGLYKNKVFSFKMKIDAGVSWAGISFRQKNVGLPWGGDQTGFLIAFKENVIELQAREGGTRILFEEFDNDVYKFGETAEVTVGAYDVSDTEVRVVLTVNGTEVINKVLEASPLAGVSGMFSVYSSGEGTVIIEPAEVDKSKLEAALEELESFIETAVSGDDYGQYSKDALDKLKAEVESAEEILANEEAGQAAVDKIVLSLTNQLYACEKTIGTTKTFTKTERVPVIYDAGELKFVVSEGVNGQVTMDSSKAQPTFTVASPAASMTVQNETSFVGNNWNGSFALPAKTESPLVSLTNGIEFAISLGAEGVTSDKPVRIVIPGKAARTVGIAQAGKWEIVRKKLTADSEEAFYVVCPNGGTTRINVNGDLVIWTTNISDLAVYNEIGTSTPAVTPTPSVVIPQNNQPTNISGGLGFVGGIGNKASESSKFTDIIGHWAENDINEMYQKGIVSGVTNTTFEPERAISRAEFATLLVKALNLSNEASVGFKDVQPEAWYAEFINAAAAAGLVSGYEGYFRPNDTITREEMAVIIAKTIHFLGKSAGKGGIVKFLDAGSISDWAYSSVDVSATAGILSGNPDGTFRPDASATRAECASLMKRILNLN